MRAPLKEKELELADEQVAQKHYSQILEAKAQQPISVQGPRQQFLDGHWHASAQGHADWSASWPGGACDLRS